jgi:hypothetical protein
MKSALKLETQFIMLSRNSQEDSQQFIQKSKENKQKMLLWQMSLKKRTNLNLNPELIQTKK